MNYVHLASANPLPDLEASRPFKAVLLIEEEPTAQRRAEISKWLVDAGCLYVMAWGSGCEAWRENVERANRAAFGGGAVPDARVVISTSHSDQAMTDVFWFSRHSAMHPCCTLDDVVLVHLAPAARGRELTERYRDA